MTPGKNTPLVTLSVVTPCYDEQDVLPAFYKRVIEVCRKFDSYELVLVDDGSTDGTWSIIRSLVEQNPHVVGVRLSRNHGHQLVVYLIALHYLGYTVQGWTSLIVVVLFVGALQLFVLGIIGEYLGRLFVESKGRPLYIVSELLRADPGTDEDDNQAGS